MNYDLPYFEFSNVRMTEDILEAQVVHGPDPKHFLSVMFGYNYSIEIVKLNEVRILQDKLSE